MFFFFFSRFLFSFVCLFSVFFFLLFRFLTTVQRRGFGFFTSGYVVCQCTFYLPFSLLYVFIPSSTSLILLFSFLLHIRAFISSPLCLPPPNPRILSLKPPYSFLLSPTPFHLHHVPGHCPNPSSVTIIPHL